MVDNDAIREERITMEIIVDCYNEHEVAMGWYYYLEEVFSSEFRVTCSKEIRSSWLKKGEKYTVHGLATEAECEHEVYVLVMVEGKGAIVPLRQLTPLDDTEQEILEAVADWHYWLERGNSYHY